MKRSLDLTSEQRTALLDLYRGCPDPDGRFRSHILLLLGDAELRRRFGRFNRERVDRHFRWERASRRVWDIYQEVLADWKRGVSPR